MNPTTFVYVIWAQGTSKIKMGISTNPEKRLRHLQTASAEKLVILGKWPGSRNMEHALHTALSSYRRSGEWFEVPPFIGTTILLAIRDHITIEAMPAYQKPVTRKVRASRRRQADRPPVVKGYKLERRSNDFLYYKETLTPTEKRDARGRIVYKRRRTPAGSITRAEWLHLKSVSVDAAIEVILSRLN